MELDLNRFREKYLLESADKTLQIGTWAAWLSLPVIVGFALQDIWVLGLSDVWIWRLMGLLPFVFFLFYRYGLHQNHPNWVIPITGLNILGIQIMMAGIAFFILSDPASTEQNQYGVSIGMVAGLAACLVIAGAARSYLYFIVPSVLLLLTLLLIFFSDAPLSRLGFLSNAYIIGLLVILFARFQERNQLREFALLKTLEERESELAAQTLHLEQVNQNLEKVNQDLESFSYTVSHDLRSPIRNLTGLATILLRKKKKDDSAVSTEIEEAIIYNANQMKQLVDEILDFSRAGLVELKREHLDMKELFRSVFQELRALEEGRQIDFHLQDLPQTEGDPTLVRQAVSNLIGNALKYTRKEELATIKVWAEEKDGEMVYCIRDNGAGFDEAQKDKLFVAFQRLHTDSEFEGVGVGLSFVQKVIQRHGGKIWASGRPNQGASFFFTLPMQ